MILPWHLPLSSWAAEEIDVYFDALIALVLFSGKEN